MPQLPNNLLSRRKRLALSQDEVAFLMGKHLGSGVSRYEQQARRPTLETALALEVILQKPARELFADLYREIEERVMARAKVLMYKADREKSNRQTARKREALTNIISPQTNNLNQI
jgi:transcriptional regulator with XRE-family HTH domain